MRGGRVLTFGNRSVVVGSNRNIEVLLTKREYNLVISTSRIIIPLPYAKQLLNAGK
jgi:hypothetical protein